jgi:hypothetical protein
MTESKMVQSLFIQRRFDGKSVQIPRGWYDFVVQDQGNSVARAGRSNLTRQTGRLVNQIAGTGAKRPTP